MIAPAWGSWLGMSPTELKERTMEFAVRVLEFADSLPNTASGPNDFKPSGAERLLRGG